MINGVDYAVSALLVFILVSVFKPFLEATLLPVARKDDKPNALHDPVIRLLAFLVGAVASALLYGVYNPSHSAQGLFTAICVGLGAALTAIGTFHVTSANYFDLGNAPALAATATASPITAELQTLRTTLMGHSLNVANLLGQLVAATKTAPIVVSPATVLEPATTNLGAVRVSPGISLSSGSESASLTGAPPDPPPPPAAAPVPGAPTPTTPPGDMAAPLPTTPV